MIKPLFSPGDPGLLLPAVRRFVLAQELFEHGDRVLVAVSGGPDSVALLHLLGKIGPEWGLSLGVAHFDHRIRGEASREDARFVAELARSLNLPCHAGAEDVRGLAAAKKISLQMAARELRLKFLEQVRREHRYHRLALGHTADDQVELFFLRLLRGAGSEGLKGMWPKTPAGLVRPLLAVGKEALVAWLQNENLPYREDRSNLSRRYRRNRVRLDLLPLLQRDYNPRLKDAVWRLMTILQEDEALLAETADQAWGRAGRWLTPHWAALAIHRWQAFPRPLQTRLLRHTLGRFLGHQGVTASQVENLADLARGSRSGGSLRFGACQVARAGDELHFFPALPPPPGPQAALLPGLGAVVSAAGWRLEARLFSESHSSGPSESSAQARLDLDRVAFPLGLRTIVPGDRFWPAGGHGARKMQDILVDAKIPRWLRAHLPLVADADSLIWVPGLGLADAVRLTSDTSRILELTLTPTEAYAARIWEMFLAWNRQAAQHP